MANNPRKFSEKIALHNQKQAEGTAEFEEKGLLPFLNEWNMLDGMKDQYIILKSFASTIKGQVKGINEKGCLLLKLDNGMIQAFSSGEVEKVLKS